MAELDLLVMGSVMVEITPRQEGQPIRQAEELLPLPSGAATNFAVAAQRLGMHVGLFSRVGDDEWGQWLTDRLARLGVDVSAVETVSGQYSPVSFCWMDRRGEKTFYFYRFRGHCDPLATMTADDVSFTLFTGVRCFDFTEAAVRRQPLRSAALAAAHMARSAGCLVIYAVNYRQAGWAGAEKEMADVQKQACSLADVAVMNRQEARLITGAQEPLEAAAQIAALGLSLVVVTDGEAGTWVWWKDSGEHVPAFSVPVLYDIGAGDAFHAGLAAALLRDLEPLTAVRLAAATAALKISRPPTLEHLPSWEEVQAFADGAQAAR